MPARCKHCGLTLIEVLVALAIVAMALMTALKVSGALIGNAQRQTDVLLGQICADNAIHQLRLSQQLPGVGDSRVPCAQAGRELAVTLIGRY
jgi:general secretion pathway protein I